MNNKTKRYPSACKQRSSKKQNDYSCHSAAQRARILEYLQKGLTITTIEAREKLDILHPCGRVLELRKRGYPILTHWETVDTPLGRHRVGKYYLSTEKFRGNKND